MHLNESGEFFFVYWETNKQFAAMDLNQKNSFFRMIETASYTKFYISIIFLIL